MPGAQRMVIFFFFQEEDGIRVLAVTGVQRCPLPIFACYNPVNRHDRKPTWSAQADAKASTDPDGRWRVDRKSTRLNSSHSQISYAVFCLKKKKQAAQHIRGRG